MKPWVWKSDVLAMHPSLKTSSCLKILFFNLEVPLSDRNVRHRKHDYGGARSIPAPKRWR